MHLSTNRQRSNMKWGRKASAPPSSGSWVMTRVFPGSWFSKFKHTGGTLDTSNQQRGKLDFPTSRQARFYSVDDDPYWTLSFRKDSGQGRRRNDTRSPTTNPLSYDSDAHFQQAPCSNNIPPEKRGNISPRSTKQPSRVERRANAVLVPAHGEQEQGAQKTESQDSALSNSRNHKDKVKTESHRRRSRGKKPKQNRKKGRRKLKKETHEEAIESSPISNSFAVVKTSFNPQQDFRDSMVEMIREKGIRRRDELQQLLASYLTLNSDTHHDLIISVFQQVWFESIHSEHQRGENFDE